MLETRGLPASRQAERPRPLLPLVATELCVRRRVRTHENTIARSRRERSLAVCRSGVPGGVRSAQDLAEVRQPHVPEAALAGAAVGSVRQRTSLSEMRRGVGLSVGPRDA